MIKELQFKAFKCLEQFLPLPLRKEYAVNQGYLRIFTKDGTETLRFSEKTGKTYVRHHPDLIIVDNDEDFPVME